MTKVKKLKVKFGVLEKSLKFLLEKGRNGDPSKDMFNTQLMFEKEGNPSSLNVEEDGYQT